jgi:predicted nucleic acid-binding protein
VTKAVLDTNIWDKLAVEDDARLRTVELCHRGELQIVVPHTLFRELLASPFKGVPNWFETTTIIHDNTFVIGHSMIGFGQIGGGEVYKTHRASAKQIADSVIVDTADAAADIFVSEDRRSLSKYRRMRGATRALDYRQFCVEILGLYRL